MVETLETERKFLISNVKKETCWEKEHIVYQWYTEISSSKNEKLKIIFDLTSSRLIYVHVTKKKIGNGQARKEITYLSPSEFNPDSMIGVPFVLKRRAIIGKIFIDKFVVNNGITEYLLENEGDPLEPLRGVFDLGVEVTENSAFYNQTMAVPFTQKDAEKLKYFLKIYTF